MRPDGAKLEELNLATEKESLGVRYLLQNDDCLRRRIGLACQPDRSRIRMGILLASHFEIGERGISMPETVRARQAARPPRKPEASPKKVVSEDDLVPQFLRTLEARVVQRGLTYSELVKVCGIPWCRALALHQNIKKKQAGAADIQALVYDLWKTGKVFIEPPARGQRVCRIWSVDGGSKNFPSVRVSAGDGPPELSEQLLKAAYDKFVPEYAGGFVPIYEVRSEFREFGDAFDALLRDLNERPEPVIELFPSDPRELTENQKRDSLKRGGALLVRMKWR